MNVISDEQGGSYPFKHVLQRARLAQQIVFLSSHRAEVLHVLTTQNVVFALDFITTRKPKFN